MEELRKHIHAALEAGLHQSGYTGTIYNNDSDDHEFNWYSSYPGEETRYITFELWTLSARMAHPAMRNGCPVLWAMKYCSLGHVQELGEFMFNSLQAANIEFIKLTLLSGIIKTDDYTYYFELIAS